MSQKEMIVGERERESRCFALSPDGACTALKNDHGYECGVNCPFFKSSEKFSREAIEEDIAAYGGEKKGTINIAKVKEYAVCMTKKGMDKKKRHDTCQFSQKNKGGSRYCCLTTNKSCTKCEFYDPTIDAVLLTLAVETEKARIAKEVFDTDMPKLERLVTMAKELEKDIKHLKQEVETEYEQVHVARYDLVQLWEDSVNTYE